MTYTITENENFFMALGQFVSQWKASKTERTMEERKKSAIAEIVSEYEYMKAHPDEFKSYDDVDKMFEDIFADEA